MAMTLISMSGCKESSEKTVLLELMPPGKTGIDFTNEIREDEQLNILSFEYFYNGAGVGIGDFNRDSLPDIFFSSNMGQSRLYLNKGDFTFNDITASSGINTTGRWATGVSIADINQDSLPDIYVCFAGPHGPEKEPIHYTSTTAITVSPIKRLNMDWRIRATAYKLFFLILTGTRILICIC